MVSTPLHNRRARERQRRKDVQDPDQIRVGRKREKGFQDQDRDEKPGVGRQLISHRRLVQRLDFGTLKILIKPVQLELVLVYARTRAWVLIIHQGCKSSNYLGR